MTLSVALRAALGIALLTAMDGVIKGQMQEHPFIVALFMRFLMGGICALIVLAVARPPRPTQASLIGNLARIPLVVLTAGSFDILVEVVTENDDDLIALLNTEIRALPGVQSTETFVYLKLVKQQYNWGTR